MNFKNKNKFILSILSAGLVAIVFFASLVAYDLPSFDNLKVNAIGSDRILYARNGEILHSIRKDFNKRRMEWHQLSAFSPTTIEAILQAEDKRFWFHPGVDLLSLSRAIKARLMHGSLQGASTITMQVTDLVDDQVLKNNRRVTKGSFAHKMKQILKALVLDYKWNKSQILEAYLNLVHLRGEYHGVPAMSWGYWQKSPIALDHVESVILATLIRAPNHNSNAISNKACKLADRLKWSERGVTCDNIRIRVNALVNTRPTLPVLENSAPHIAHQLFNQYSDRPYLLSTLDLELQKSVSKILTSRIFGLRQKNVKDGAAVVIDNSTGEVLAYVGSVNTSAQSNIDGAMAFRQAGSTLKPFLYGKALDTKTITPASIILDDDTPIQWGDTLYRPANYDRQFYGAVTFREALGSSLNVPAIKIALLLGLHETYKLLTSLNLSDLKDPDFYGVSMALGAVDVRLIELANAYRAIANSGSWSPIQFVNTMLPTSSSLSAPTSVSAATSATNKSTSRQIMSKDAAYIISMILSDPYARSIGFGLENYLETPYWSAAKTGTSKDYRDNWCIGFSEKYTVGVWVGNFDATPMKNVSGITGAGPVWREIMDLLHQNITSRAPERPANVITKNIKHEWTNSSHNEFFISGTEPENNIVEQSFDKRVQFVFPANQSVLIKDPKIDAKWIALYVRFKGFVPKDSRIYLNDKDLGLAESPFRIEDIPIGLNRLLIKNNMGEELARTKFRVKGVD